MRAAKKVLFRTFIIVTGIVSLLALGTLVPRPLWPVSRATDQAVRRIVLLSNPIHTDIAIPLDDRVLVKFAPLLQAGIRAQIEGARYLVFGWGGRAFYLATPNWSDLRAGPLLSALTIDSSVMHVDVAGEIDTALPSAKRLDVSDRDFDNLTDFIIESFRHGSGGPIRIRGYDYGEFDGFFEANGHFNAFAGCNTWTAQALRAAGLRTGWWNPIPQSLGISVAMFN